MAAKVVAVVSLVLDTSGFVLWCAVHVVLGWLVAAARLGPISAVAGVVAVPLVIAAAS